MNLTTKLKFIFALIFLANSQVYASVEKKISVFSENHIVDDVIPHMRGPKSIVPVIGVTGSPAKKKWLVGSEISLFESTSLKRASDEFICHGMLSPKKFHNSPREFPSLVVLSHHEKSLRFPKGFGLPLQDELVFSSMIASYEKPSKEQKYKYKLQLSVVEGDDSQPKLKNLFKRYAQVVVKSSNEHCHHGHNCHKAKPATPNNHHHPTDGIEKDGEKFTMHWLAPPGKSVYKTNVTKEINLPYSTTLHFANLHLHDGVERVDLIDLTTDKTVLSTKVDYTSGMKTEAFSSIEGIKMSPDHQYELVSYVNNKKSKPIDIMSIMFLYFKSL